MNPSPSAPSVPPRDLASGIHKLTQQDYAAVDAANAGTLIDFARKSPYSAIHQERRDTIAFALGRAVHTLTLEPWTWDRDFAIWDDRARQATFQDHFYIYRDGPRRGKAWDQFQADLASHGDTREILSPSEADKILAGTTRAGRLWDAFAAAHPGKTILTEGEFRQAVDLTNALLGSELPVKFGMTGKAIPLGTLLGQAADAAHPAAGESLRDSAPPRDTSPDTLQFHPEVTVLARIDGALCKIRVDLLIVDPATRCVVVIDLKTCDGTAITEDGFARDCRKFGYGTRAVFYADVLTEAFGFKVEPRDYQFACVDKDAPHETAIYFLDDEEVIQAGRHTYRAALRDWQHGRRTGHWRRLNDGHPVGITYFPGRDAYTARVDDAHLEDFPDDAPEPANHLIQSN